MQPLHELIEEAGSTLTLEQTGTTPAVDEAARILLICNACRYCEGYCAVFPAMTRRIDFASPDVHYLANLCHSCGACLHACQYAPPHEFAVNVPQAMARVRGETYQAYAWPASLGRLYQRQGLTLALALAAGLALFLVILLLRGGGLFHEPLAGDFYKIFPHDLMAGLFGVVSVFVVLAMSMGLSRFWREVAAPQGADATALKRMPEVRSPAGAEALKDGLSLRHLDACNNADDAFTPWRRYMHQLTFGGFMLCFAATTVATLYHYLFGWHAPYAWFSLPVVLGTVGGVAMVAGCIGLWTLRRQRHALHGAPEQAAMDKGFIALLFLTGVTGLLLLALRSTGVMGLMLALHLGCVMALFLTLPYGKFVHGFYRLAALLKHALERRLPSNLKLSGD